MPRILVCWVGNTDLKASRGEIEGVGPIANALAARAFDVVQLLADYPKREVGPYIKWLETRTEVPLQIHYHNLKSPINFEEIFPACRKTLKALQASTQALQLTFHLSPGTPHGVDLVNPLRNRVPGPTH